jgi:hypothetical protein
MQYKHFTGIAKVANVFNDLSLDVTMEVKNAAN